MRSWKYNHITVHPIPLYSLPIHVLFLKLRFPSPRRLLLIFQYDRTLAAKITVEATLPLASFLFAFDSSGVVGAFLTLKVRPVDAKMPRRIDIQRLYPASSGSCMTIVDNIADNAQQTPVANRELQKTERIYALKVAVEVMAVDYARKSGIRDSRLIGLPDSKLSSWAPSRRKDHTSFPFWSAAPDAFICWPTSTYVHYAFSPKALTTPSMVHRR